MQVHGLLQQGQHRGRVFCVGAGQTGDVRVAAGELCAFLDRLYTPRIRRANLVLCLPVDGLPTPLERFLTVGQWMTGTHDE